MSKKHAPREETEGFSTVPFQVKARQGVREKLKIIAEKNGLSLNDVASMCIAAGIPMVETKLGEIYAPKDEKQAA